MSIAERLKALADFEGSQTNLAKKTGLTTQVISRTINKGAGIHSDTMIAVAEAYPNLNLEWFITGKGEMWKSDISEKREEPLTEDEKDALKDEIIALQKTRIKQLEQEIKDKNPELAKRLGIE